jgi:hypothetical protein
MSGDYHEGIEEGYNIALRDVLEAADRLYFRGGYRTINRAMLERSIREAVPASPDTRLPEEGTQ